MSRRASLPGASELFRPTRSVPEPEPTPAPEPTPEKKQKASKETEPQEGKPAASGRVRHDHKITVYFSEEELLALEDANLDLRRSHGIRVDRGRIVRVAVARALADLAEQGADSYLVDELGS
ncbi:hypothetical protein [Tessaracoccus flavescens]|uniref:Cobyrinic acid a,c-diamide synthase n=1 Tax=Tessaracoccus flavescens TaxID=399497 RepID=A0A1Q2D0S0_9ACTN|nr:hypothetical protein [Tessaracoccus flavescens]AQP51932.1 hypothetical protein BW733_14990 [Tessaracoccus flavescens]